MSWTLEITWQEQCNNYKTYNKSYIMPICKNKWKIAKYVAEKIGFEIEWIEKKRAKIELIEIKNEQNKVIIRSKSLTNMLIEQCAIEEEE